MKSRIGDFSALRGSIAAIGSRFTNLGGTRNRHLARGKNLISLAGSSPTPCKRNEMLAGLSFQIYRAAIFYIRCENSYNPPPLSLPKVGLRSIQRCLPLSVFPFEDLIYHRSQRCESNESKVLLVVVVVVVMASCEGVSLTEFWKGAKGSKSVEMFGETLTVVWKGIWGKFSILFRVVIGGLSFVLWDWWECVFLPRLLHTCAW